VPIFPPEERVNVALVKFSMLPSAFITIYLSSSKEE
jgi:hypothetical protein